MNSVSGLPNQQLTRQGLGMSQQSQQASSEATASQGACCSSPGSCNCYPTPGTTQANGQTNNPAAINNDMNTLMLFSSVIGLMGMMVGMLGQLLMLGLGGNPSANASNNSSSGGNPEGSAPEGAAAANGSGGSNTRAAAASSTQAAAAAGAPAPAPAPAAPVTVAANLATTGQPGSNGFKMDSLPLAKESISLASPFGMRIHPISGQEKMHNGADMGGSEGEELFATAAGTAKVIPEQDGRGNTVEIDHGNGFTSVYFHLQGFDIQDGQQVQAGQQIGRVGSTGGVTGPHLHFELWHNGEPIDPWPAVEAALG